MKWFPCCKQELQVETAVLWHKVLTRNTCKEAEMYKKDSWFLQLINLQQKQYIYCAALQ